MKTYCLFHQYSDSGMQYAANIVKFYNPYHVHDSLIHDFNFKENLCALFKILISKNVYFISQQVFEFILNSQKR